MNAAIAYLETNGYADDFEGMMDGDYLNHAVMVTVEATFFEEELSLSDVPATTS